jgi:hypothetical protein
MIKKYRATLPIDGGVRTIYVYTDADGYWEARRQFDALYEGYYAVTEL